jgi:hypothetical protein
MGMLEEGTDLNHTCDDGFFPAFYLIFEEVGMFIRLLLVTFVISFAVSMEPSAQQNTEPKPAVSQNQPQRLELMKSKGTDNSLTILPIRLTGRPFDRISEIVGLFFEQQGLQNIEIGKTNFDPGNLTSMEEIAVSLGEFIKKNTIATGYVLYAEYNGDLQTGLDELRAVVVDKTGAIVWTDHQRPQDEAFKRLESTNPMSMSVLLVERLSPHLGLNEQTAKAAKPGKMARLMAERSGLPPESESAPLPGRQKEMKESRQKVTLLVCPVRIDNAANTTSAVNLASRINAAGLCKAVPEKQSILLKSSHADPNEMKALWDLAREFRDYVKRNPSDANYVLYADYVFNPQNWEQGFVHFVVCDRNGEWVIMDMQNSHHEDYGSVKPTSSEGCDQLLVKRLESYLR